jgi:hypothetical protein
MVQNIYTGQIPKSWMPGFYSIEVAGEVDESLSERLGGMRIVTRKRENGATLTTLTGRLEDQAELSGVLNSLYEMHLTLLSVKKLSERQQHA